MQECNYCEEKAELYCLICFTNVCKEDRAKHLVECEKFDIESFFMAINLKVDKDSIYKEAT